MEIRAMNAIITFVEQLPHSVTENIDYHIVQVILLYSVIGGFCYLLYHRSRKVFWTTNVLLTLFCCSFVVKKMVLARETAFLAYHIRKCSALEFNYCGQTVLFSDSIQSTDDNFYRYNVLSHARRHHLRGPIVPLDTAKFDTPFLCKRGNFIRFHDRTYYLLSRDQRTVPEVRDGSLAVDCLLLRQNPRLPPDEMMARLPFREVVADGSNTMFYIERWRVFCKENGIPFRFTGERKN